MSNPTLKIKVLPRFPSSVSATSPILLDTTGGNYNFSLDANAAAATSEMLSNKTIDTAAPNTIKIGGVDISTAWATYTPTITSASGTFTGATVTATGRYKQIGKVIHLQVDITLTAVGSGSPSSALVASLPISAHAATAYTGAGRERVTVGTSCIAYITTSDASHVNILPTAGGTIIANSNVVTASITYEAA